MFSQHGEGTSMTAVAGGKRRVHTTFEDGTEMVEEYDIMSNDLLTRRWKSKGVLGNDGAWEYEIGQGQRPPESVNDLRLSSKNPIFSSHDTKEAWEWRVRNIPYPKEVYQLSVDKESTEIILRTTNRKFYKRFKIPTMVRLNLKLNDNALSYHHSNTTLIIQYDKPDHVLDLEAKTKTSK